MAQFMNLVNILHLPFIVMVLFSYKDTVLYFKLWKLSLLYHVYVYPNCSLPHELLGNKE